MDENESSDSINETGDDSNECNESDNKLTQYMLINKELSKNLVVLRAENAKLRTNNKELNLENLTYRNELTSNRNEIMKWRRKFTNLQAMHIQHVETLTTELQSYANKLTSVFDGNEDNENEVASRVTEQHTSAMNSPSIIDDCEDATTTRISNSSELLKTNIKQPDVLDENPSSLNTICEEGEDDFEASDSEQISLVTSTHESTVDDESTVVEESTVAEESTVVEESTVAEESTLADQTMTTTTTPESACESTATKTIIAENSMSDSSEMASMDSDKENERPSSFFSSKLNITNGTSPLIIDNSLSSAHSRKPLVQTIKQSITPLKEKFITTRRTQKRKTEQTSFDDPKAQELASSTPYKRRKRSASHTEISTPVKANDSPRMMTRRTTIAYSSSGRPKRSVCPVNFVEPKLNTKLRRPRTYDK